jgi:hypothetical protein
MFASVSDVWGSDFGTPSEDAKLRNQVRDPLCEMYERNFSREPIEKKQLKQFAITKGETIIDAYANKSSADDAELERYLEDHHHHFDPFMTIAIVGIIAMVVIAVLFHVSKRSL